MENYTTGVQHVGIPTKKIEETKVFYKKLGFQPVYETVYEGAAVSFLRIGNLTVEVYESKETAGMSGAIDHIALDVRDIEATYRKICEMGLNTTKDEIHKLPYWENGVRFFTIQGPNEEKIEFSQYL